MPMGHDCVRCALCVACSLMRPRRTKPLMCSRLVQAAAHLSHILLIFNWILHSGVASPACSELHVPRNDTESQNLIPGPEFPPVSVAPMTNASPNSIDAVYHIFPGVVSGRGTSTSTFGECRWHQILRLLLLLTLCSTCLTQRCPMLHRPFTCCILFDYLQSASLCRRTPRPCCTLWTQMCSNSRSSCCLCGWLSTF